MAINRTLLFGEVAATSISLIALIATGINAWTSYNTFHADVQAQQTALFTQFQEEYNAVAARFPGALLDPNFRPAPGSAEYRRLEEYWIFVFAEWFATHDLNNRAYKKLWDTYYATLVANALDIPSLRYALIAMKSSKEASRGAFPAFYADLSDLAGKAGKPLQ